MKLRFDQILAATSGSPIGDAHAFDRIVVDGVSIDSRSVAPGNLFVPLRAERDGHDFVGSATAAGAVVSLWSSPLEPIVTDGAAAYVRVNDTAAALSDLGKFSRTLLSCPVIGITGSVGKTSAKDLARSVISADRVVSASERSFNNEIGVPLTLANVADDAEAVVVEMGARGPGHIEKLCELAAPTIGVVLCVAGAHLETFGSIEGVAKAKGELVEALPATGTAILNRDDPNVAAMAKRTSASVLWFGTGGDISATNVVVGDDLRPTFDLNTPDGSKRVTLGVAGAHHVTNALAAAAIGIAIGVPLDRICVGLEAGAISPWRMELRTNVRGTKVLNDAYNANPTSMEAALRSLASLPADRRIAVMGTMAEVGESSGDEHARIGEVAQSLGLECLSVAEPSFGVANVDSIEAAASRLSDLGPGDAVLVKGSRVAGLERLAALLMAD